MNKKGSFTIEAALIFPVFILIWVPFLYLMRYCILYEVLQETAHQTAQMMAVTGYLFQRAGLKDIQDETWKEQGENRSSENVTENLLGEDGNVVYEGLVYCEKILNSADGPETALYREGWKAAVNEVGRIAAARFMEALHDESVWELLGAAEMPHMEYSEFFYAEQNISDWISIVLFVPVNWPDPFNFFTDQTVAVSSQVRAFIGINSGFENAREDENETEKEIYYRIGNGSRYHSLSCYLIQKETRMVTQEDAVQQGYQACGHCKGNAQWVWITPKGEKYHIKGCPYLFPDVKPLSEEEMMSGRYTPCAICQTDGGWFS